MTSSITTRNPQIIVALDCETFDQAGVIADALNPGYCRLKVGKELFTRCGPSVVEMLQNKGFDIFLDLKFHDIPNTVAKAVKAAAELGVWMVNVHTSGGSRMMSEARNMLESVSGQRPLLIGVTVLTSMDGNDLRELGIELSPEAQVLKLAGLAQASGLDGVVCSALEAKRLKQDLGKDFALVTPGIRPIDATAGDQRRVVTPEQAIANGSDYLVIGRPITEAANPSLRCQQIAQTLSLL